jgi:hypothetical protein
MRIMWRVAGIFFAPLMPHVSYGATTTLTCDFTTAASPQGLSREKGFALRFIVDPNSKKAYVLGNLGSSEVTIVRNTDGISFVDITASGNVMVTTVTDARDAVHSRNSIVAGELVPSQYYGTCTIQ